MPSLIAELRTDTVHLVSLLEADFRVIPASSWGEDVQCLIDGAMEVDDLAGVLVWNSVQPRPRALCRAARLRGLPAIEIEHGAFATYLHGHFETDPAADHIVTSPEHAAFLRAYGYEGTLHELGRPGYDHYAPMLKEAARRRLSIPVDPIVILRTSTWVHPMSAWSDRRLVIAEPDAIFVQAVLEFQKRRPAIVIYSLRPGSGISPAKLAGEYGTRLGVADLLVTDKLSLLDLIPAADVVVSPKSSAAAEAVLLDRPAILLDIRPQLDVWAWAGKGIIPARSPGELLRALLDTLYDGQTMRRLAEEREGAKRWFFGELPASERVAARIKELCHARQEVDI